MSGTRRAMPVCNLRTGVMPVMAYRTEDEAVALANDTVLGLSAGTEAEAAASASASTPAT